MIPFLVVVHIIVSLVLMLVVLVQQGKGADLAGAFGGGGSQTVFGARGATTLLHKLTVIFFVLFVFTSLSLAILQMRPKKSLLADQPAAAAVATPETPAPLEAAPATEAASGATTEDVPAAANAADGGEAGNE